MKKAFILSGLIAIATVASLSYAYSNKPIQFYSFDKALTNAMEAQGFELDATQISLIRENAKLGVLEACKDSGNSRVGFTAVEIAQDLSLNPKTDKMLVNRISNALESVAALKNYCTETVYNIAPPPPQPPRYNLGWEEYYNKTVSLNNNQNFISLLRDKEFSPVKISWEDIGRYDESVWGDRISDVGIWVRKNENDSQSAQLALSVRRDNNYRDKVLVVPANQIKVHLKQGAQTIEKTLPQRLQELGLSSPLRDKNVIVSNQFAIVPVPAKNQKTSILEDTRKNGKPPRVAFNFSIYPYGSTNYVITDVIEGSSDAIVGSGSHQMLYANINDKKAPFTASRAEERQDLLQLEKKLKAQGMDVDVQRYYLIQVPLKKEAKGIQLSNMGTPPINRAYGADYGIYDDTVPMSYGYPGGGSIQSAGAKNKQMAAKPMPYEVNEEKAGLSKVAIGHGEAEGKYFAGSGFRGQRADEPIRVTVIYFVTPVGEVSQKDVDLFASTFKTWDNQAIWGGSFVVKTANK